MPLHRDPWQRVLWKRQLFSDNYVPPTFLSLLQCNSNFRPYTFFALVLACSAITQHVATVSIFFAAFVGLANHQLDPRVLVWLSIGLFATGYIVWEALEYCTIAQSVEITNRAKVIKSSILVFLALLALSPVLRTLTAATSLDSIWALSAVLLGLHLLLADYSPAVFDRRVRGCLSSVLSMNAALSASVVLASRLRDNPSVFALVLFSVHLFVLLPFLRQRLQAASPSLFILLAFGSSSFALRCIAPLSQSVTRFLVALLAFISFGAPAVLIWAQRYKNEIKGPWDVAVPRVRG